MIDENTLYLGDADTILDGITENVVDIIVTDPPYIKDEWRKAYTILAKHASRILKPSGWLVTYSGHYNLKKVMDILDEYGLEYYWEMCQLNGGQTAMVHAKKVICGWKPILIYQKPPFKKCEKGFYDVIHTDMEKSFHPWQQSLGDLDYIVPRFANRGDLLVEPFAGSGTTVLSAKKYGLRWIACEIEPKTHRVAASRVARQTLFERY